MKNHTDDMSDTPITDSEVQNMEYAELGVEPEVCRKLERALTKSKTELAVSTGIINAALKELPVGYVPTHTSEYLSAMVRDQIVLVGELSGENDRLVAELATSMKAPTMDEEGRALDLARGESATPAKEEEPTYIVPHARTIHTHPDTERVDWLESQAQLGREKYHANNAFVQCSWFPTGDDGLRDAIDAAIQGTVV